MEASRRALARAARMGVTALAALAAPAAAVGSNERSSGDALQTVDPAVGPALTTHGIDPQTALVRKAKPASARAQLGSGASERAPVCASADTLQVLYARPLGVATRYRSRKPTLQAVVRRMNAKLNADALASGGPGADLRVACEPDGSISVGTFRTLGSDFSSIVSAARAAGFAADRVNHLVFHDGWGVGCGIASYEDDDRLTSANRNNLGGGYAVVYRPCWAGSTALHETAHMMGAVQYWAPNSTGTGGHCHEERDVVCYAPDGGDRNQAGIVARCFDERFDCNFDDYFDTLAEPGEYLSTHWNLGSSLNRFLAFGESPPPLDSGGPAGTLIDGGRGRGAVNGLAPVLGGWRHYTLKVPARARALRVRLQAAETSGLELHLRHSRPPTDSLGACRRPAATAGTSCRLGSPRKGRWIAGVLNRNGAQGAPFRLSARVR